MAIAAEGLRLAAVDAQQCPEAVILDLVNPATPGRRVGRQYSGKVEHVHVDEGGQAIVGNVETVIGASVSLKG